MKVRGITVDQFFLSASFSSDLAAAAAVAAVADVSPQINLTFSHYSLSSNSDQLTHYCILTFFCTQSGLNIRFIDNEPPTPIHLHSHRSTIS